MNPRRLSGSACCGAAAVRPPLPRSAVCEELARVMGVKPRVQMKQRAHRPMLVIEQVVAGQVSIEVVDQQLSVLLGAETGPARSRIPGRRSTHGWPAATRRCGRGDGRGV